MHKQIDDNKTELFLTPIPKWITTYGFIALLVFGLLIITFTYFFEIPDTVDLDVTLTRDKIYATCDFNILGRIKESNQVKIISPFTEEIIKGELLINDKWVKENLVFIPINAPNLRINLPPFEEEILFEATVTLESSSLLFKIINK